MKITFGKNEPWRDCRGKHARIEVFEDGKQIGWISGELDCGIGPGMKYEGHGFRDLGLREIKAAIRQKFSQEKPRN